MPKLRDLFSNNGFCSFFGASAFLASGGGGATLFLIIFFEGLKKHLPMRTCKQRNREKKEKYKRN